MGARQSSMANVLGLPKVSSSLLARTLSVGAMPTYAADTALSDLVCGPPSLPLFASICLNVKQRGKGRFLPLVGWGVRWSYAWFRDGMCVRGGGRWGGGRGLARLSGFFLVSHPPTENTLAPWPVR